MCIYQITATTSSFSAVVWAVALGRDAVLDLFLTAAGGGLDFKWATKARMHERTTEGGGGFLRLTLLNLTIYI